ncbi:MAG: rhodanese-like domain-containing protein [Chitinophagaceae bacterium]
MGLFSGLFGPKTDFKGLADNGAIIVDVRTPMEYRGGHIKGSLNIPLDTIRTKVAELKKKGKPVITCCASGMRSASAANILNQQGVEAYNGGPWSSLNHSLN